MRYGVPYKGSKNQIAEWVCSHFPKATNFYDLFAGGCVITQIALMKQNFNRYFANDIDFDGILLFMNAVYGKYQNESRWISREDFIVLKNKDPYIKYCWSFGNNGRDYLYSKEIEPYKRACHYAIVFDDWKELERVCPEIINEAKQALKGVSNIQQRRLNFGPSVVKKLKRTGDWNIVVNNPLYMSCHWRGGKLDGKQNDLQRLESLQRLQSLESLERLQSLQSLQSLQRLSVSNKSFDEVEILPDSVIYCFDKETEILTKRGWINVGDCTLDDYCLSREPNSNKLQWVKIVNLISYHYKGKMYCYSGKNVDLCVTPNHKMFVNKSHNRKPVYRDEFIEAQDLYKTPSTCRFISAGGEWDGDDSSTIEICGETFDKLLFAYLLGIFMADGSVNNQGSITIFQKKPHIVKKIETVLEELKIQYSLYDIKRNPGSKCFYICRKYLPYFKQFYLKENRSIPADVKNWSKKYLEKLLEGIIDGDSDGERRRIATGSKSLVNDIQEICYKLGFSSSYQVEQPKDCFLKTENRIIHGHKPYYVVSVNHKLYLSILKYNQKMIDYDDTVNCVTLEKWHTVLVRRNGKCIWCGQCDIPYVGTDAYVVNEEKGFNHVEFYKWALQQKELVIISEYNMPDDFICIDAIEKSVLLNSGASKKAIEKLFIPKHQRELYKKLLNKKR